VALSTRVDVAVLALIKKDLEKFVAESDLAHLNYPAIARALRGGDERTQRLILEVLRAMAKNLGFALASLSAEYHVDSFVFGGGLMEEREIADHLIRFTTDATEDAYTFRLAQHGNQAGLIGAAVPFMQCHKMGPEDLVLTVDMGGTKIAFALVGRQVKTSLSTWQIMTPKNRLQIIAEVAAGIRDIFVGISVPQRIKAITVCSPGIVLDGVVRGKAFFLDNNQPFDFRSSLVSQLGTLGLPPDLLVSVINDAEAATWGEKRFGAGRDLRSFILMTLGTGLGGAFADVYGGVRNIEPGERSFMGGVYGAQDTVMQDYPGKKKFEEFVSGTALVRMVKNQLS
jgi:predicted NBD/HSP70 family sugar kinase